MNTLKRVIVSAALSLVAAAAGAQSAKATGGKPAEGPPAIAAREAKAPITVPLSPLPAPASRRKNES